MNKADLVRLVSNVVGTQGEAKAAVAVIFEKMGQALKEGDKVVVQGFGSFRGDAQKQAGPQPRAPDAGDDPPRRRLNLRWPRAPLTLQPELGRGLRALRLDTPQESGSFFPLF
ncbi:MAG: HU family DNA-binding protein [Elusimicrobia bacterium]|nr:HU family DNA-binding protein [Elusimicrobiota bacterium]